VIATVVSQEDSASALRRPVSAGPAAAFEEPCAAAAPATAAAAAELAAGETGSAVVPAETGAAAARGQEGLATASGELTAVASSAARPHVRRLMVVLSVIGLAATAWLCVLGYRHGIFTSRDALTGLLARAGAWAPIVFIGLQIIQVVIPIIPGGLSTVAGVLVFGPVWGFVYNYIGIAIGSFINFGLARKYGKPFVQAMMSERAYTKYLGWLDRPSFFDKWFPVAILLPISPDDYLCFVAGLTRMTLRRFALVIALCKPVSIASFSIGLAMASSWVARMIG
jgi:uncharacterized membrane protein YdjX (TVP38/TMEM64 family)